MYSRPKEQSELSQTIRSRNQPSCSLTNTESQTFKDSLSQASHSPA